MAWAPKGALAVYDQALLAGSHFILNILLARWLPPAEYGAFAIAYSSFLLVAAFHTALFTEPMMVFGSGKFHDHFGWYLNRLVCLHFLVTVPLGMGVLAYVGLFCGTYATAALSAVTGVAVSAPFILLLWLARRALYARLRPGWAALGGGVYCVLILSAALSLRSRGCLSPLTALLGMGFAGLASGVLLLYRLRKSCQATALGPSTWDVARAHWQYGRWAAATAGPMWVSGNICYLLLPSWVGLDAAGALKALTNLALPALHVISALALLVLPVLSRARGAARTRRIDGPMDLALVSFLAGSGVYLGMLLVFGPRFVQLLYGARYRQYGVRVMLLVGLLPVVASVNAVFGAGLRALERPDGLFWAYLISAAVAVSAAFTLLAPYGVHGALLAVLLSSAASGAAAWRLFLQISPRGSRLPTAAGG